MPKIYDNKLIYYYLKKRVTCVDLLLIKTHNNESQGQEEATIIRETKITQPLSELFKRKTAKKIANALAKLP